MRGIIWITDREPEIRRLFGELLPEAERLAPDELRDRLNSDQRPDALIIDGTQLLELAERQRTELLALPRLLVCTGLALTGIPISIVAGPNVSILAKPFCVDDLEVAIEWLRGTASHAPDARSASLAVRPRGARADVVDRAR